MPLKTIVIIVLGYQVMLNITRPLITLFALDLGASTIEIGLITSTYAFFPLIVAIHAGKICDHIGDRYPMVIGLIGLAIGIVFPYYFHAIWSLYISQSIVGISQLFLTISIQNVLGNLATKDNRDYFFGMFSMASALGGVIGPISGGYLAEYFSYPFAFLVSALIGLIPITLSFVVPVIIRMDSEEKQEKAGFLSSFHLLKNPLMRKALASSSLVVYSRDTFIAYFPLFAIQLGISDFAIGWIIAVQGLSMVIVRIFLVKLTGIMGRKEILLCSILMAGIAFVFVPFTGNVYLFCLLSAIMGAGLGFGEPLSMTTAYNASPKMRTGEVLGLRLASNRMSQLVAPVIFGLVGSWAGVASVFFVSGILLVGGAFLTKSDPADEIFYQSRSMTKKES